MGTAGPPPRAQDPSGHCRTSTATSRSQWALPDLNRDFQIAVGTAGPQPRLPDRSGHCRTSTATSRSQWALLDLNRHFQIAVGTAGPQPPLPDRSGHCRTSTATSRSQWALPDLNRNFQIAVGTAGPQREECEKRCLKGDRCTYAHEWNSLNDKEKRCWKRSNLEHIAKDCTAGEKVTTSPGDRSSKGSPKGKGKTKDGKNDKGKGKDRDKPAGGVDQSSKDSQPQVAQIQQQPQVAQTQQQPQVAQAQQQPRPAAAPADQRDLELRLHAVQAQSCSTSPGWRQQWHRGSLHMWQGCLRAVLGPLQELCSFLPPLSSWLIKKCMQINPIKQCKAIQPTCKMEGYPAHDKGELSSPTKGEASSVRNAIHPILAAQKSIAKSIAFSIEIEFVFQSCFQLITSWFLLIFCLKKPFSIATWFCSKIKRSINRGCFGYSYWKSTVFNWQATN